MRFFTFLASVLVLTVCSAGQAQADYFVWRDVNTGLSLSFPDTWRQVNNSDSSDVITIMPPSGRGNAMCRMRESDDKRFTIYPPRYDRAIQAAHFSENFWDLYLKEYSNETIVSLHDAAGLGRGFASYIVAEYDSPVPGPYMHRRALMFVSNYYDKTYVLECSSQYEDFARWKGPFLSIAGSVDFRPMQHSIMTGNYYDFTEAGDPPYKFHKGSRTTVLPYNGWDY